jgi:hypothetical protein
MHELVRDAVGLNEVCAQGDEHLTDGGFAAGNAAGEADFQQIASQKKAADKLTAEIAENAGTRRPEGANHSHKLHGGSERFLGG